MDYGQIELYRVAFMPLATQPNSLMRVVFGTFNRRIGPKAHSSEAVRTTYNWLSGNVVRLGIAALHRLDAATKLPCPRRPPHSIFRFLVGPEIDQAGCHSAAGSIERYAGDAAALGQQLLLSPEVGRYRVRRTRALMIEIPAARSRQLVLTRGKPRLSYTPLMKIVRC